MTRFEFGNQFVELTRNGTTIEKRWGASGRFENSRVETFHDEAATSVAWIQQLRRLEHRGYRPGKRNAELEAVILSNPDDANAYLVYADWLQEQNDARGVFISTMIRGGDFHSLLDTYREQFEPSVKQPVTYGWRRGFFESVHFETPHWATVRRVLRHPSAFVLRSLTVTKFELPWRGLITTWNALAPLLPKTLERIEVEPTSALSTQRSELAPELQKLLVG